MQTRRAVSPRTVAKMHKAPCARSVRTSIRRLMNLTRCYRARSQCKSVRVLSCASASAPTKLTSARARLCALASARAATCDLAEAYLKRLVYYSFCENHLRTLSMLLNTKSTPCNIATPLATTTQILRGSLAFMTSSCIRGLHVHEWIRLAN